MNMGKYQPNYIKLLEKGILHEKVKFAKKLLTHCNLCPHECGIDRRHSLGFCRASDKVVIASFGPHFGEEKPLVGSRGSGTIFFGYCNMRCVFCQNCEISFGGKGDITSNADLSEIMLLLQNHYECHNINLVTPTHFVPNILEALLRAAKKGLQLPIVYNCGGYENIDTLRLLEGVIDIYMPDFKYHFDERGYKYSGVVNYPQKVKAALKEMDRQVGGLKLDDSHIAYRGLLIRHLVMPGGLDDTKEILQFIKKELSPDCLVNVMGQYYPANKALEHPEISRRLDYDEYKCVQDFAKKLGLRLV